MKDNFQVPNLGNAPASYDQQFFNRFLRGVELVFQSMRSAGPTGVTVLSIEPCKMADLPGKALKAGMVAYVSDGRKHGETAGNGTGVLVFFDGSAWCACDTGLPVSI